MYTNIERPRRTRQPVQYDAAGNPLPQNLTRHLVAAELPDAEFEAWLDQQCAAEDERLLRQLCKEAV